MDPINGFRSAAFTRIDISFNTMLASLSLHHHSSCRINFNPDKHNQVPAFLATLVALHFTPVSESVGDSFCQD